MGSIRDQVAHMNLDRDVFSLVNWLLDMIDDKDTKLTKVQKEIDEARTREENLKSMMAKEATKLGDAVQRVKDLEAKEQQLTKKVEDQQKQITEARQLNTQLASTQEKLENIVKSLKTTIDSTVLPKVVSQNVKNSSWSSLKKKLSKVLDKKSKAYNQLSEITTHEREREREPLREVCKGGRIELLALLLHAGLPVNTIITGDPHKNTMVHAAAAANSVALQLLMDHGANFLVKNSMGLGPLTSAVQKNNVTAVRLLLSRGVDVNIRDTDSNTPLHWAAKEGHSEVAELLLDAGASALAINGLEMTPLDYALANGHEAVAELLMTRMR